MKLSLFLIQAQPVPEQFHLLKLYELFLMIGFVGLYRSQVLWFFLEFIKFWVLENYLLVGGLLWSADAIHCFCLAQGWLYKLEATQSFILIFLLCMPKFILVFYLVFKLLFCFSEFKWFLYWVSCSFLSCGRQSLLWTALKCLLGKLFVVLSFCMTVFIFIGLVKMNFIFLF